MADETASGVVPATVKHEDTKESITVSFDFKATLEEAVEAFTDKVVHANFVVGAKTQLRNKLYSLTHGKGRISAEEALEKLAGWLPSMPSERAAGADPLEAARKKFESLDDEARLAYIEKLKAVIAGT